MPSNFLHALQFLGLPSWIEAHVRIDSPVHRRGLTRGFWVDSTEHEDVFRRTLGA